MFPKLFIVICVVEPDELDTYSPLENDLSPNRYKVEEFEKRTLPIEPEVLPVILSPTEYVLAGDTVMMAYDTNVEFV